MCPKAAFASTVSTRAPAAPTSCAGVGFVPQLPPPLKMTVADLVAFASGVSGADAARIGMVAGELGLDLREVAGRPFVKLSGGQKQKLLIAIALGRQTQLLILDEPAANLDPAARQTFFQLLAARGDNTMIVSSHRVDEVSALVTRVIEMERGRIAFDNRLAEDGLAGVALRATVTMSRYEPAFVAALEQWGFSRESAGPGVDRFGRQSRSAALFMPAVALFRGDRRGVAGRSFQRGEERCFDSCLRLSDLPLRRCCCSLPAARNRGQSRSDMIATPAKCAA